MAWPSGDQGVLSFSMALVSYCLNEGSSLDHPKAGSTSEALMFNFRPRRERRVANTARPQPFLTRKVHSDLVALGHHVSPPLPLLYYGDLFFLQRRVCPLSPKTQPQLTSSRKCPHMDLPLLRPHRRADLPALTLACCRL